MAVLTCGRFTFDQDSQTLEGPGEYMTEKGNALVDSILGGNDVMFNMTCSMSPSPEMAVMVRLQTDYAGWVGNRQVQNWMGGKRPDGCKSRL